jgi:hypothetical protein
MKSYIVVAISVVLLVSAVVFSGCKGKETEPETEVEPEVTHQVKPDVNQEAKTEAEKAALKAAEAWLQLIDDGKYSESWLEAAQYVRKLVNRQNWQRTFQGARQPLGKLISRKLKSTRYTTSAPGAPDGQYVIIQYDTKFRNKASAVETITPMLDKDGKWRVSGYYVR